MTTYEYSLCLNPCCSGYRSATAEAMGNTTATTCLNPCCSGYRSATCYRYNRQIQLRLVSILVVVDIGLRPPVLGVKGLRYNVSILVVVDIGLRQHLLAVMCAGAHGLNPCCSGYRSATYSNCLVLSTKDKTVSILVVVDIGLRRFRALRKEGFFSVSILVVVDIGLRPSAAC